MDKWDKLLQTELSKKTIDLNQVVNHCCHNLNVHAQQVIDHLLSIDDKEDIINGDISEECLRAHIKTWLEQGAPHYATKSSKKS